MNLQNETDCKSMPKKMDITLYLGKLLSISSLMKMVPVFLLIRMPLCWFIENWQL